jgi:hypothetical protein
MLMRRFFRETAPVASQRRSSVLHQAIEPLEPRLLLAANAWKSAVSGSWDDASKWSLGHVPDSTEDVSIVATGNYTVTVPTAFSAQVKSLKVGGTTGTQALAVVGSLYTSTSASVGSGDAININAAGTIYLNGITTLNSGKITLNGAATGYSTLYLQDGAKLTGTGEVVFATGGTNIYNQVYVYASSTGVTIDTGITLRGKSGYIYNQSGNDKFVNKGTIKVEGSAATDRWTISYLTNAGTLSVNGAPLTLTSDFKNTGTFTRATAVHLAYTYDAAGGTFALGTGAGKVYWAGGTLKNGSWNPATLPLTFDAGGHSGYLDNVKLTGDLAIPAGKAFYVSNALTLTGSAARKITLNGDGTTGTSTLYLQDGAKVTGTGEVVFNTGGSYSYNQFYGYGYTTGVTIDAGITVRGKSGRLYNASGATDKFVNKGTVIADTAGETIQLYYLTNSGSVIAAPGKIAILYNYKQSSTGSMTVGIGGTTAGTSYGRFTFANGTSNTLGGTFNAVSLNNYKPAAGTTFTPLTFDGSGAPAGAFNTKNLDAGNGLAFDFTQSATGVALKAKTVASPFAVKDSAGLITVTGTTGVDTIATGRTLGIFSAVRNGVRSVFLDKLVTGLTINAGDGDDVVTVSGRSARINGGKGLDKLTGSSGNDTFDGGDGNDTLTGGLGDDVYLFGNSTIAQTDTIVEASGGGVDKVDFSTATGVVTINLSSDTATATAANRTVKTGTGGAAFIENAVGGTNNDIITGNGTANVLVGNAGNDTLNGGNGNDTLSGGAGNDSYLFGNSTVAQTDTVIEASGGGTDKLDFGTVTTAVTINLSSDTALATAANRTVKTGATGQAVYFENAIGGSGNDTITGNSTANTLLGGAGNDKLNGGSGSDTLVGGTGDDTYVFGNSSAAQTDVVEELAGGGVDTLDFTASTNAVTINLSSDTALATAANLIVKTKTAGQAAQFENARGGTGADTITGNAVANKLYGGAGADKLTGAGGTDSLFGEAGADTLYGADSGVKDLLDGGADTDILGSKDSIDTVVSVP